MSHLLQFILLVIRFHVSTSRTQYIVLPDSTIREGLFLKLKIIVTFLFTPIITTQSSVNLLLVSTSVQMKHTLSFAMLLSCPWLLF